MLKMHRRKSVTLQNHLETLAKRVLAHLKAKGASVDVILLSEKELGTLKTRFKLNKKGKRPDVLAFPEPKPFPHPEKKGRRLLGEVYLNEEIADDDMARLEFLLIHGILHLSGFSHEKKNDILRMEKLERELMQKFFHR